jgi:glycosyltransferase involved in cell wall biosynthesis
MRLLFVHQHLGALGGAEGNVYLTANELKQRGHVVGLLYERNTGRSEEQWKETFSERFRLPGNANAAATRTFVEDFAPDVVWLHNLGDLDVIEALLGGPAPVVRTVHDHAMYCMRAYKYNYFTRNVCTRPASLYCVVPCLAPIGRSQDGPLPLKWVSYTAKRHEIDLNQRCQRLLVFSDYVKEELLRNGFDAGKIDVQAPLMGFRGAAGQVGVQTSVWSDGQIPSDKLTLELQPTPAPSARRNLILWAGQIIRGKGLDLFLRALAKVKTQFECIILGEGSHRTYCEWLCSRLGLSKAVQFRGFVAHEEMDHYYREASVFAVSSVWPEPFGLSGPEAMRYGLPVVAFDAGAVSEWLTNGEDGFLVPWMDVDSFAARLEDLLGNPQMARAMGARAQERVSRQFNRAQALDRLEGLLLRVARETQGEAVPAALAG